MIRTSLFLIVSDIRLRFHGSDRCQRLDELREGQTSARCLSHQTPVDHKIPIDVSGHGIAELFQGKRLDLPMARTDAVKAAVALGDDGKQAALDL